MDILAEASNCLINRYRVDAGPPEDREERWRMLMPRRLTLHSGGPAFNWKGW
ncbi:MAG: hypothetical protein AMXMBFR13_15680 [Phycisphaerae bacterium]